MSDDLVDKLTDGMQAWDLSAPVGILVMHIERGYEVRREILHQLRNILPEGWVQLRCGPYTSQD